MVTNGNVIEKIQNPKNWKKTHKKQYEVYMCRPLPGTECINRTEGSKYVTDVNKQFIISGTVGETWVIDVDKLANTYTFADGTPITSDTLKNKCEDDGQIEWVKLRTRNDASPNWAFHLPKSIQNFPVQTAWGDILYANRSGIGHLNGDFLVCSDAGGQPNLNDVWVVNGEIFPRTYDLHAFPNMFTQDVIMDEVKKPIKVFVHKCINTFFNIDDYAKYVLNQLDTECKNNNCNIKIEKVTRDNYYNKERTILISSNNTFESYGKKYSIFAFRIYLDMKATSFASQCKSNSEKIQVPNSKDKESWDLFKNKLFSEIRKVQAEHAQAEHAQAEHAQAEDIRTAKLQEGTRDFNNVSNNEDIINKIKYELREVIAFSKYDEAEEYTHGYKLVQWCQGGNDYDDRLLAINIKENGTIMIKIHTESGNDIIESFKDIEAAKKYILMKG